MSLVGFPIGMELDGMRFHHVAQNCVQFKTYEFISVFFLLIFSDSILPQLKLWTVKHQVRGITMLDTVVPCPLQSQNCSLFSQLQGMMPADIINSVAFAVNRS